jgi:dUTP pyrophosphatase
LKTIEVKVVNKSENKLPEYETEGAAGLDLRSDEEVSLSPGEFKLIKTNLFIQITDQDVEMQIRSRSGLTFKHGIIVLNSPGTIDSDYIGPINVILFNAGKEYFHIEKGDRIAQAVFNRIEKCKFILMNNVSEFEKTLRGVNGFGSTGIK